MALSQVAMPTILLCNHRSKTHTEEKANVVAAVWGAELMPVLAALAILHLDDLRKRVNCTRMI